MGKPLHVLVITNDHPDRKTEKQRKAVESLVHALVPPGTRVDYATYGCNADADKGERNADLPHYDLVIMPGTMAEHFGTPAVVYRDETTEYEPDSHGIYAPTTSMPKRKKFVPPLPFNSVPVQMKFDPAKRKLPPQR